MPAARATFDEAESLERRKRVLTEAVVAAIGVLRARPVPKATARLIIDMPVGIAVALWRPGNDAGRGQLLVLSPIFLTEQVWPSAFGTAAADGLLVRLKAPGGATVFGPPRGVPDPPSASHECRSPLTGIRQLSELLARIRAVMRRGGDMTPADDVWEHGELRVDFGRLVATRAGAPFALTPTEFRILKTFVRSGGLVLTVEELLQQVWGADVFLTDRVVYTHMNNLLAKIEDDPTRPTLIVSVRGAGYRFEG